MNNLPTFINDIVRIWNIHQHREDLYKQAMTLDNVGSLRRVCSHGYISSLLFKKEIQWIYDGVKCSLQDGDINLKLNTKTIPAKFFGSIDRLSIARILREQEQKTIRIYNSIISGITLSKDEIDIFSDHLQKLKDIDFQLNKELIHSYENVRSFQVALAS
ncbi:hypothetical protein [Dyadobacter sp. CY312]|uniref:hypothetical protein n=1 Tax=Dyadobacter sp. CY312 TaxID=2907303 RepID=UPI001F3D0305|nr:hypothetical protein [Dyadobacter sp. CY312]MCE7042452.1 hypothetical protein [Dyadobacter sp. CY312]